MTIIHAEHRFGRRDPVAWFIESRGIEPIVHFRSGARMGLRECRQAEFLVRLLTEAERLVPAAGAVIEMGWDDRSCHELTVIYSAGMLDYLGHPAPPRHVDADMDGARYRVSFEVIQDAA